MPLLLAVVLLRRMLISYDGTRRNDMMSLIWDTAKDNIKCEISAFGSIKLERKNSGKIFLCLQDGNSRVRIHKDTFTKLYQYKTSIHYLISLLDTNVFGGQHREYVSVLFFC